MEVVDFISLVARIGRRDGYSDQAHLIDELRTIASVTPRAPLAELGADR
jgi:hypothetical protein